VIAVTTLVDNLVSRDERTLKTRGLDIVEYVLLLASALLLLAFTVTVLLDVVTRLLREPILWLQEATLISFVWGVFVGAAVAQRRREHFVVTSLPAAAGARRRRLTETGTGLVLLAVGLAVACFGFVNFQQGFGNQLPVTGLPLATLTGAIPVFGVLLSVFVLERLIQGWRHGFVVDDDLEGGRD